MALIENINKSYLNRAKENALLGSRTGRVEEAQLLLKKA